MRGGQGAWLWTCKVRGGEENLVVDVDAEVAGRGISYGRVG